MTTAAGIQLSLKRLLLTTDFSPASDRALPFARALAHQFQASVTFLYVMPPISFPDLPLATQPTLGENEAAAARLHELAASFDLPDERKEELVRVGDIRFQVEQAISDCKSDLVVLGSHGAGGLKRLFLGSAAEEIFRRATCPVLTVGPGADVARAGSFDRLLVAANFDDHSEHAFHYSLSLARRCNSKITFLYIVPDNALLSEKSPLALRDAELRLRKMIGDSEWPQQQPDFKVVVGNAAANILDEANRQKADLVIMGARRAGDLAAHLSNFAHTIVSHAPCPVLTVAY